MTNIDDELSLRIDYMKKGMTEELKLHDHLLLAMELMDDDFEYFMSCLKQGEVHFTLTTDYPKELPENVGMLFFNIDPNYKVKVEEFHKFMNPDKRYYKIEIKKS